jgi:hypothetical protein
MLSAMVPATAIVFSAAVNCVEMVLIVGYLSQWPVIMTLVVFALYASTHASMLENIRVCQLLVG